MTVFSPGKPLPEERVLLRELHHRIDNSVAAAINLVSAAAVRAEGAEAKAALSEVVELLHGYADVHRALQMPEGETLIDAATYIRKLGCAIRRAVLDRMNIRLAFATESLPLQPERCWRLGLTVHELVTSAAQHTCFDARAGEIQVKLTRNGALVNCTVLDNGSRPARGPSAQGLRIGNDVAKGLGGALERRFGAGFTSVALSFLLSDRERQANWSMASRRMRGARRSKSSSIHQAEAVPPRRTRDPLGALFSPPHRMDAQ